MKRGFLLAGLVALSWLACRKEPTDTGGPEIYAGRLVVHKQLEAIQYPYIDSDQVTFTVDAGTYELKHAVRNSGLCDSYGVVRHFGTNELTLIPSGADFDGNCDQLRIPSGTFEVVFKRDSLIIGPDTQEVITNVNGVTAHDTMVFLFQLTQR